MKFRQKLVLMHRYVGLVMAGFLIITGLSGVVLVWYNELDASIIRLYSASPDPNTRQDEHHLALSAFELRTRTERAFPDANVNWMMVDPPASRDLVLFYLNAKTRSDGTVASLPYDEVFVDRYSGEIVGQRRWGDISQGVINLMPFMYRLHQSLALGKLGTTLLGVISLLWLVDCFVGLYLTFPARSRGLPSRFRQWKKAWKIRWMGGRYKMTFDLHRAGGVWAWIFLSMFALSSIAMTLETEIYRPVMSVFMDFQDTAQPSDRRVSPRKDAPEIGWERGFELASSYLDDLARDQGFTVLARERFAYYPERNVLKLMSRTSLDVNDTFGQTWVFVDASTGQKAGYQLPTGAAVGDTFTVWLTSLHIARIGGLPYRVLVSFIGVLLVVVTVTGVLIWWRKRQSRVRTC